MALSPIRLTTSDRHRLFLVVTQADRAGTLDHGRALGLAEEIREAEVIAPAEAPPDLITMRTRFRVTDLDTGETSVLTLAYPEEADPAAGAISVLAPPGAALLGQRVGDTVSFADAAATRRLRLDEILFQPEAAGRYDL